MSETPHPEVGDRVSNATGPALRRRRINMTLWQAILFAGAALVGIAALSAAGLAIGLALAGAGVLAAVVLGVWVIAANLVGMERRRAK